MPMDQRLVKLIGTAFPVGTKRRWFLSSVAGLLGMAPQVPGIGSTPGSRAFNALAEAALTPGKDNAAYWAPIRNLLQIKTELFLSDPESSLEFPAFDTPAVSILLVTFNSVEYTFQCLETVKAHTDVPYEVIIVDNASTDRTGDLLGRLSNAKVIRNTGNTGFLRACNTGAKAASGKYILFLNNDTQVTAGWLAGLVSAVETYPECGAAGAKLLQPDGRLQEAGCIIWRDGSTSPYGRGSNPFVPEVSYLREVDYCGGACLLVRKDLFVELGGFDERYAPAYYEEADLCMGIRERGHKVVYQPASGVIHYEYGSGSFRKALKTAQVNQAKFAAKWKKTLDGHLEPSGDNLIRARDKRGGRKVLVVHDGDFASDSAKTAGLINALSGADHLVTLFVVRPSSPGGELIRRLRQKGVEVVCDEEKTDLSAFSVERKGFYEFVVPAGVRSDETDRLIKKYFPGAAITEGGAEGVMKRINGPKGA